MATIQKFTTTGSAVGRSVAANDTTAGFTISQSGAAPVLEIPTVPASAAFAVVSAGNGPFDGTSAGRFVGAAGGTILGINTQTGYAGNLADWQIAGSSKFRVDAAGNLSIAGNLAAGTIAGTGGSITVTPAVGGDVLLNLDNTNLATEGRGFLRLTGGRVYQLRNLAAGQLPNPTDIAYSFRNATDTKDLVTISRDGYLAGALWNAGGRDFNVRAYGAKGDVQRVVDASTTAGSATIGSASANFQATDVGKYAIVNGGGASLVTTVAAYVSATQITLAAAPTFSATGATLYWATDDTAAIQAAVNAAYAVGGGKVTLAPTPWGYYCAGNLVVKEYVCLEGHWEVPQIGAFNPSTVSSGQWAYGSALLTTANAGGSAAAYSFLTVNRGAAVKGVAVFHPAQTVTNPPIAYPPAVQLAPSPSSPGNVHQHMGGGVLDVLLVNAYQGVWCVSHEKFFVDGVYGQCLNTGVYVDNITDVPRLRNCHFWQFWHDWDGTGADPISAYTQQNFVAYKFARVDGLIGGDLSVFGCYAGVQFTKSANGNGYGLLNDIEIDGAKYGIIYDDANFPGWIITGFNCHAYYGNSAANIWMTANQTYASSNIRISGFELYGGNATGTAGAQVVQVDAGSQGSIYLTNGHIVKWDYSVAGAAAIKVASGTTNVYCNGVGFDPSSATTGVVQLDVSAGTSAWTNTIALQNCVLTGGEAINNPNGVKLQKSGTIDGQEGTINGRTRITTSGLQDSLFVTDTGSNGANIKLVGNGSSSTAKFIRACNGNLDIMNSAYNSVLFRVGETTTQAFSSFTVASSAATPEPFITIQNTNLANEGRAFLRQHNDRVLRLRNLAAQYAASAYSTAYAFRKYDDSVDMVTVSQGGYLAVPVAVPATANQGLVSLGAAPFDGATAGYFRGSAGGTAVAVNAASGYTGYLLDYQIAGASQFSVDTYGNLRVSTVQSNADWNLYVNGGILFRTRSKGNGGMVLGGGGNFILQSGGTITLSNANSSTSTTPVLVSAPAGMAADMQQWQVNGANVARVTAAGEVVAAAEALATRTVAAAYTITTADSTVLGNTASGAFAVTLPAAAAVAAGRRYTIKNIGANTLTVTPNGTDQIDGANTSQTLAQYAVLRLQSDGGKWWII